MAIHIVTDCLDAAIEVTEEYSFLCDPFNDFTDVEGRTWSAYLTAAKDLHGAKKIEELLEKYKIDTSNTALNLKQVIDIEKGASILKVEEIAKKVFSGPVTDLTDQEISDVITTNFPNFTFPKVAKEITSTPSWLTALVRHNRMLMDQEIRQLLDRLDVENNQDAADELLVKGLIPRELDLGTVFKFPINEITSCYYFVYAEIMTGDGAVVYGFKPLSDHSDALPIIACRGTLFYPSGLDAISTIINDLETNIGASAYESAKKEIDELISDPNFRKQDQLLLLKGFSLGGALCEEIACDNPHLIGGMSLFSPLGIKYDRVKSFANWVNAQDENYELTISHHRVAGDCCDHLGDALLGLGIEHKNVNVSLTYVYPYSCLNIPPFGAAHSMRFLSSVDKEHEEHYDIRNIIGPRLQTHLDNCKRGTWVWAYKAFRDIGGPYILCPLLKGARYLSRNCFPSRGADRVEKLRKYAFDTSCFLQAAVSQ